MSKIESFLYRRFIGIEGNVDEYKEKEITKKLSIGTVLVFYLIAIFMGINLIMDLKNNTISFGTISLFIIFEFLSFYIVIILRKNKLDETECYSIEEYKTKIKKLKKTCFFAGLIWGVQMLIWMQIIMPYILGENINLTLYSIMIWTFSSILFGIIMYFFSKSKLKKEF